MIELKDIVETITPPHECPHEDKILAAKFRCGNLKLKDGEFYCVVCRCPYDNTEYKQEKIIT